MNVDAGKGRQVGWRFQIKRAGDKLAAALALVLLSPLILLIACAVRLVIGSPVLFVQTRPGKSGAPIRVFKFRTMEDSFDTDGTLLQDAERLTPLGRLLRSLSLDELPQLFNVIGGDLSIVGPRPLLMQYLDRYTPEQAKRHSVMPGITGWAQVNGRNAISWDQKFELDAWYVDNWSLWLDLRIVAVTALRVVQRRDVSNAGHSTMPEFMGPTAASIATRDE